MTDKQDRREVLSRWLIFLGQLIGIVGSSIALLRRAPEPKVVHMSGRATLGVPTARAQLTVKPLPERFASARVSTGVSDVQAGGSRSFPPNPS